MKLINEKEKAKREINKTQSKATKKSLRNKETRKMKSWLICFALLSMLVMSHEVAAEGKFLNFSDLCLQPSPPKSCYKDERADSPIPYDRGCSPILRCRGG
ncbi:hypothetical protein Csa_006867 [Cucumis sativus]|uniref:Uncharacterized protein n=1 Tax=Cucumis sativus TaxID=3659 RepID=A0A0A0LZK3_CUCSA|nr:hypothetical protein Csa_006867 [Cucumis sativus]